MSVTDKYYAEVEKAFASEDEKKIVHKLNDIRQNGKPAIIPLIANLMGKHKSDPIEKVSLEILGQLKEKECIPYVIESIKSANSDELKRKLIMTCWQSGLDYNEHIIEFAREFLIGSFEIAIEAFSVIEEWIHDSPMELKVACTKYLKENINLVAENKKSFYLELVKLVESHT